MRLEFEPDTQVDLAWAWEMRKTGSIPPGTTIWWRWRVQDADGREYLSDRQELAYTDARFEWQSYSRDNITLYWYAGGGGFGATLADATADGLATLELRQEMTEPINAFIYADAQDVRDAVLFAQEWVGGLAFPTHNILLIAVPPNPSPSAVAGLVHELAHLLVEEVTFNCFGDLPRWLDEGLATYAEGPMGAPRQSMLDRAAAAGELVTLRSLSSSFAASHESANLSYAQSRSIVAYLIDTYGWERMRQLLETFAGGSTYDAALLDVYEMDAGELDLEWRASLGL